MGENTELAKVVTEALNQGLSGPDNLGNLIAIDLQNSVRRVWTNWYKSPMRLSQAQQTLFQKWSSDTHVTFTGENRPKKHPLLRAAQEYSLSYALNKMEGAQDILVIGSNYTEARKIYNHLGPRRYRFLLGSEDLDYKDKRRLAEGKLKAQADNDPFAKDYLACLKHGKSEFFQLVTSIKDWPVRKYDVFLAIDSLYDINPHDLKKFCKSCSLSVGYFTMHMVAELFLRQRYNYKELHNETFGIRWQKDGKKVNMTFDDGSLGYSHLGKNLKQWCFNTSVTSEKSSAYWEPEVYNNGYGLFTFALAGAPGKIPYRVYYSVNDMVRIFDVLAYFDHGRMVPYFVNKEKFNIVHNYVLSLNPSEEIKYHQIVQYMRAQLQKLVVANKLLSSDWNLHEVEMIKILEFVILYVSMDRQELFEVMKKVGQTIRQGGIGVKFFGRFFGWRYNKFVDGLKKVLKCHQPMREIIRQYLNPPSNVKLDKLQAPMEPFVSPAAYTWKDRKSVV